MPEHTSFVSYLLSLLPGLSHNAHALGQMLLSGRPVAAHDLEPITTSALLVLFIIALAAAVRPRLRKLADVVVPETRLSPRTFLELFVGYFYGLAKDIMGAKRAKRFFPVIGTCAIVIFFSNLLGLIPGFVPPTSNLNITAGCALFSWCAFNYYGVKENGLGYFKHLFGPWLGIFGVPINLLIFVVEALSTFIIRPATLAIRLMVNMAVDHLVVSTFLAIFALLVPLPVMFLGIIVIVVQTLVFCLLTSLYIGLATEHEEHH